MIVVLMIQGLKWQLAFERLYAQDPRRFKLVDRQRRLRLRHLILSLLIITEVFQVGVSYCISWYLILRIQIRNMHKTLTITQQNVYFRLQIFQLSFLRS